MQGGFWQVKFSLIRSRSAVRRIVDPPSAFSAVAGMLAYEAEFHLRVGEALAKRGASDRGSSPPVLCFSRMSFDPAFIVGLVLAITVHEFSHAWVANHLGDPTAKYAGRISLNPMVHLDLMGTVMLFLVGFGWGKPVPVNPYHLHNPKRDSALVSLAGPASNILFAMALALPYKFLMMNGGSPEAAAFLRTVFDLNLILAIFNFIPLPPLDGSKMIGVFVPEALYSRYERFLDGGVKYFIAFVLIDSFVVSDLIGFSVLSEFIRFFYVMLSSLILIGT